ncbi:hypothetical protein [Aquabacter cavernae]|uniref:hypothetical protein n=1 Tax=Aquabacter cavernae TaxID=2496029 RepID=UPI000F8CD3DE|nr:hypothetical protein [Aquabacter cavernae]
MKRRMVLAGLSAAILSTSSVAALAAPCGPAVLSKVDGKVLVNRGVGFLDGKAGMPLAVGDHVMLRGGTAEILFVNGTGSALSGAKSMAITACSADASRLTNPALAGIAMGDSGAPTSSNFLFGSTPALPDMNGNTNTVTRANFGVGGGGGANLLGLGLGVAGFGTVMGVSASRSSGSNNRIISIQPLQPVSP